MVVNAIPNGFHSVTPYFLVADGKQFINFVKQAFGAVEIDCTEHESKVVNAILRIGDSMIMLGETRGDMQPMPCTIYLYVPDTDAVYHQALKAGAESLMEPADQFYGDRNAGIEDPQGNRWWIATHIEDVTPEEMERRMANQLK